MIFDDYIKNINLYDNNRDTGLYPVSSDNIEYIGILVNNSIRMSSDNINVELASFHPILWMGDFLDKYYDKISYVAKIPVFTILKVESSKIISKSYSTETLTIDSDKKLDEFFNSGKWKKFALFSVSKYIDLSNMKVFYKIKYADVSEKYEVIDNKINDILDK